MTGTEIPTTGQGLRELREAVNVSMFDVATRLKTIESGLSAIERGRKDPVSADFAERYCLALAEITEERAAQVRPFAKPRRTRRASRATGAAA